MVTPGGGYGWLSGKHGLACDNVVSVDIIVVTADRVVLQLAKQPGRRTCAGLRVLVRRHLSGQHSV